MKICITVCLRSLSTDFIFYLTIQNGSKLLGHTVCDFALGTGIIGYLPTLVWRKKYIHFKPTPPSKLCPYYQAEPDDALWEAAQIYIPPWWNPFKWLPLVKDNSAPCSSVHKHTPRGAPVTCQRFPSPLQGRAGSGEVRYYLYFQEVLSRFVWYLTVNNESKFLGHTVLHKEFLRNRCFGAKILPGKYSTV